MRLGVERKALCRRSLRVLAGTDARPDAAALDELIRRAERQADVLEDLRVGRVAPVLAPDGRTAVCHPS